MNFKGSFRINYMQEFPSLLEEQQLYCTGFSLLTTRCELQNKIEYKVERAKLKNQIQYDRITNDLKGELKKNECD